MVDALHAPKGKEIHDASLNRHLSMCKAIVKDRNLWHVYKNNSSFFMCIHKISV